MHTAVHCIWLCASRKPFLPFCPSLWLPACLSVRLSVYLLVCLCSLCACLSFRPSAWLPVSTFVRPSACLPVCLSICLSLRLSVRLLFCLPVCICLSESRYPPCVLSAAFSAAAVSLHHVNRPPELSKMTHTIFLPSGLWHETKPLTCLFLSSSEPCYKPSLWCATQNNNACTSWNDWVLLHQQNFRTFL